MSRFFRRGGDSSDESSSSEEELLSQDESENEKPKLAQPRGMSRFLRTEGSDESSEESDSDDDDITSEREKPTKLDTGRARALNTTKHKIRKSVKEYETELQKYKDDPDAFTSAYLATMQPAAVSKPAPTPRKVAIEAPEVDDE